MSKSPETFSKGQSGITLIKLIAALVLTGILSAIVLRGYRDLAVIFPLFRDKSARDLKLQTEEQLGFSLVSGKASLWKIYEDHIDFIHDSSGQTVPWPSLTKSKAMAKTNIMSPISYGTEDPALRDDPLLKAILDSLDSDGDGQLGFNELDGDRNNELKGSELAMVKGIRHIREDSLGKMDTNFLAIRRKRMNPEPPGNGLLLF